MKSIESHRIRLQKVFVRLVGSAASVACATTPESTADSGTSAEVSTDGYSGSQSDAATDGNETPDAAVGEVAEDSGGNFEPLVDVASSVDIEAVPDLAVSEDLPNPLWEGLSFNTADYGPVCDESGLDLLAPDSLGTADGIVVFKAEPGIAFWDIPPSAQAVEQLGQLCAGASDEPACFATVDTESKAEPGTVLIETRGDEVLMFRGAAGLVAWMGAPDSTQDAVLLAREGIEFADCDAVRVTDSGWDVLGVIKEGPEENCAEEVQRDVYYAVAQVNTLGALTVVKGPHKGTEVVSAGCAGRRPKGMIGRIAGGRRDVGAVLASAARDEAASVFAFLELARDLAGHGAPVGLVAECRRAAADEVRHAVVTARLATDRGASLEVAMVKESTPPTSTELAVANAVDGCVGESWAALLATHQAAASPDAEIAAAMAVIAADETRHAALAWSVADWLTPRLPAEGRLALAATVDATLVRLGLGDDGVPDPRVRAALGLPSLERRAALFAGFRASFAA